MHVHVLWTPEINLIIKGLLLQVSVIYKVTGMYVELLYTYLIYITTPVMFSLSINPICAR